MVLLHSYGIHQYVGLYNLYIRSNIVLALIPITSASESAINENNITVICVSPGILVCKVHETFYAVRIVSGNDTILLSYLESSAIMSYFDLKRINGNIIYGRWKEVIVEHCCM